MQCLYCKKKLGLFASKKHPFCSEVHETAYQDEQAGLALRRVMDPLFTQPVQKPALQASKVVAPPVAPSSPDAPSVVKPPEAATPPAQPLAPILQTAAEPERATFRAVVTPPASKTFLPQTMPAPKPSDLAPAGELARLELSGARPQLPESTGGLIHDQAAEPERVLPQQPSAPPETPLSFRLHPAMLQQKPEGIETEPPHIAFPGAVLPVKFHTEPYMPLADTLSLDVARTAEPDHDAAPAPPAALLSTAALGPQPVHGPTVPRRNLESTVDAPPPALRYPFADLAPAEAGAYRMPGGLPESSVAALHLSAPHEGAWLDRPHSLLDASPLAPRYPLVELAPAEAGAYRMPGGLPESSVAALHLSAPHEGAWLDRPHSLLDASPLAPRYPLVELAPAEAGAYRMPGGLPESSVTALHLSAPHEGAWLDQPHSLLDASPLAPRYPLVELARAQATVAHGMRGALPESAARGWMPAPLDSSGRTDPAGLGLPQSFTTPPPVPRPAISMPGTAQLALAPGGTSTRARLEPHGAAAPHTRWKVLSGLREAPAKLRVPRPDSLPRKTALSSALQPSAHRPAPQCLPSADRHAFAPQPYALQTWTSDVTLPGWRASLGRRLLSTARSSSPDWAPAWVNAETVKPQEASSFDPVRSPGLPARPEPAVGTAAWIKFARDGQPDRRHTYRPSSLVADLNGFQRVRAASFIQIREPELRGPSPGDFRGTSARLCWSSVSLDREALPVGTPVPLRPAVRIPQWAA